MRSPHAAPRCMPASPKPPEPCANCWTNACSLRARSAKLRRVDGARARFRGAMVCVAKSKTVCCWNSAATIISACHGIHAWSRHCAMARRYMARAPPHRIWSAAILPRMKRWSASSPTGCRRHARCCSAAASWPISRWCRPCSATGDVCVQDKLNHASLIDAARLSGCTLKRYPHADADAAARQLACACRWRCTAGQRWRVLDGWRHRTVARAGRGRAPTAGDLVRR